MKIPEGLTQKQVLDIIQRIGRRLSSRYTFGYYDADDLRQECFLIALDGLENYDGSAPLENFLSVHIHNRIKNFVRDNYFRRFPECEFCTDVCERCRRRKEISRTKKNLVDAIDWDNVDLEGENSMVVFDDFVAEAQIKDAIAIIDEGLPADMRGDYLKMRDGAYVQKNRREEIYELIRGLFHGENWG